MKLKVEDIRNALRTRLTAGMPAALDVIDAEYNDGITLDDIVSYYGSEKSEIEGYPAVSVLPSEIQMDDEEDDFATGNEDFFIVICATDTDEETLTTRLMRYCRAMASVLTSDRTLGGIVYHLNVQRVSFRPMFTSPDSTFLKDAYLRVRVKSWEL